LLHETKEIEMIEERKAVLMDQMRLLGFRATLLQRTLTIFYSAAGLFVLTSVAIGIDALLDRRGLHWMPVALGLSGALGLLYGNIMLIREAGLAVASLRDEMRFMHRMVDFDTQHSGRWTRPRS
jgi:hypothetical protein